MKTDYDIVILGGGAAGLFAASIANALNAKTCMIEKIRLGGDCTWFGCMPSKALLKSSSIAHCFRRSAEFGLQIEGSFGLNTDNVMRHVKDIVDEISTHHPAEVFEKKGINVVFGAPQFINGNSIDVKGQKITAKRFIICTGSHPVVPPIEGLKDIDYLTNETIFDIEKLPNSLIVLGGGPIGVELSQSLNRLGVSVSIVEMMDRILFREDREIAKVLENTLKEEGVKLYTAKKAIKFVKEQGQNSVILEDRNKNQEQIQAEKVLVAVGRAPNLDGLSLERAGVEYTKQGIKVNKYLQTTNRNIFACGDVVGPYMFSHVAAYQASVCVRNALFRRLVWQKADYSGVTWATFTDPELAHLGFTEEEAKEKYSNISVYKSDYTNSDRSITDVEKKGLLKVITDKRGFILGAHIVGAQAGEIIQGFLLAKSLRQPLSKIAQVLFIYPTLSELIKKTAAKHLIKSASRPCIKTIIKLMKRK
jgi:pyruvate/2-oxoglutarate dehydrogenase complex dihydrolipoamide dehydrogenase (E3) component